MEYNYELFNLFPKLRHELCDAKIKEPMEPQLHASSNVISMNSLNTIIANSMKKSKLGEASFMKMIFLVPQL